jgi:hypothetical protein
LGRSCGSIRGRTKAQLLRELLAGNSKAQEKRQHRIKLLTEQVQLQQSRLQNIAVSCGNKFWR